MPPTAIGLCGWKMDGSLAIEFLTAYQTRSPDARRDNLLFGKRGSIHAPGARATLAFLIRLKAYVS